MQKFVNLVDLVKGFPTTIYLQRFVSIQPRTSLSKFAKNSPKVRIEVRKNIGEVSLEPKRESLKVQPALHAVGQGPASTYGAIAALRPASAFNFAGRYGSTPLDDTP